MWCWLPLVLLGLPIAPADAASAVLLEKTEGLPPGWVFRSSAKGSEKMAVSVVLKEPGMEALKHKIYRRSADPDHPEFGGRHLSREEIRDLRKPDGKAVNSITSWLRSSGVQDFRIEGSAINFIASVNLLELLFKARMGHYSFGEGNQDFIRTLNYTVPAKLRDSIDFVHPLTNFIAPRGGRHGNGKHGPKIMKGKDAKGKVGKGQEGKGKDAKGKGKDAKSTSKAATSTQKTTKSTGQETKTTKRKPSCTKLSSLSVPVKPYVPSSASPTPTTLLTLRSEPTPSATSASLSLGPEPSASEPSSLSLAPESTLSASPSSLSLEPESTFSAPTILSSLDPETTLSATSSLLSLGPESSQPPPSSLTPLDPESTEPPLLLSSSLSSSQSSSIPPPVVTLPPKTTTITGTTSSWPVITLRPDDPYWGDDHGWEDQEPDYPCLTGTFPECIRELYNITYNATGPSPSRFGVAGFLEQWIHHKDMELFVESIAPEIKDLDPPHNYTVELFRGGENPQPDDYIYSGLEAALDVQYALTVGYPAEVVYYVTGGRGDKLDANGTTMPHELSDNEPYLDFLEDMLAKPNSDLPHVLSISYADDEMGIPRPYAYKVCDLFAALTARGVSIFVATGDGGAAGTGQTRCTSNDGQRRKMYVPTFPASCPYVTAVGAVSNVAPPLSGADFSSGGFSNYFARPDWQKAAVDPYVNYMIRSNDDRVALFNASGRAMPDISAIGSAFQIYQSGNLNQVLGTSASTPVVAAMVALVNDARLRAGKPSLGWINPLLYSDRVRNVLRDVTWGRSYGCYFPDDTSMLGWRAGKGYDCVTGLGTVDDFNDFLEALA